MSKEDLPPACKQQRFKGVESFLRRLAFNLGNTPSQTEVKIISCIPIDVTDLQQKIITLEKELYETKVQGASPQHVQPIDKKPDSPTVNVSSALYGSAVGKPSTMVSHCNVSPECPRSTRTLSHCCDCRMQDKSNVSFAYPAYSTLVKEPTRRLASAENSNTIDSKHKFINTEVYRNIFKKRKRKKIFKDKLRTKTQLVYYAQTHNPFSNELQNNDIFNDENVLSHTYLEGVFRKHHDPKIIVEEFSDTSHFSKPVCRDVTPNCKLHCTNASDICSCCHGSFQNIDNYMDKYITFEPNKAKQFVSCNRNNKFDDPYDMIPVKERSIKPKNTESLPKFENYVNMKCWPEKVRTKYRYHPFIVNYELERSNKKESLKNDQYVKKKVNPTHLNIKLENLKKKNLETGVETSKSCCIECGDIYKKPVKKAKIKSFIYKNECVATDALNTNIQLNALNNQTDSNAPDNTKTEVTLNQIKNILQSVLAEVKTNSNINNAPKKIIKKDAMIQKGTSQNNMQGASTLLHSFTYNNSYNANPYLASCSRQIPSGQYYPGMPCEHGKYLQNFPVFIQNSPGRHMCACYYRSSAHKTAHSKRATTAGTNTDKDIRESSSKETEKLIKEIYKSIALNMDYPNRDTSVTEYDDIKSTENSSMNSDAKELVNTSAGVIEMSTKRDTGVDVIISPLVSNTTESKLVYTAMSSQTLASQKTKMISRDQSIDTEIEEGRIFRRLEENDETDEDDDTDESSSSVESNYTVVPDKEDAKNTKVKTGFLQKVFKSVFKKKKRTIIESETDKSAVSDSDDYETIYSEKVNKTPTYPRNNRSKPPYRSPATDANYMRVKRTPYLEQEYRRQWNENLMFYDNQKSRQPSSRPMTAKRHYNSPYRQEYEARSAMVDPIPRHRTMPSTNKVEQGTDTDEQAFVENVPMVKKNLPWLKKHKLGIHCGERWKNLILEN